MIKPLITVLTFCLVFPGWAQNFSSRSLRMDEAIQLGLENSKQLKLSNARTQAFQAKVEQLKNTLIPNLTLTSGYTRISDNISPYTVTFGGNTQTLNPQILNQYTNKASIQRGVNSD